ncbi:hypothetical protein C8J56DRAFT_1052546 [Mycena floridula]|nr:hypothetical protein C8J56DRAFT_1052546 [Mycena floridula]
MVVRMRGQDTPVTFILSVLLAQLFAALVNRYRSGLKCPGTLAVLVCGIAIVVLVPLGMFVILRIRNWKKETDLQAAEERLATAERTPAFSQAGYFCRLCRKGH